MYIPVRFFSFLLISFFSFPSFPPPSSPSFPFSSPSLAFSCFIHFFLHSFPSLLLPWGRVRQSRLLWHTGPLFLLSMNPINTPHARACTHTYINTPSPTDSFSRNISSRAVEKTHLDHLSLRKRTWNIVFTWLCIKTCDRRRLTAPPNPFAPSSFWKIHPSPKFSLGMWMPS